MSTDMLMLPMLLVVRFSAAADASDLSSLPLILIFMGSCRAMLKKLRWKACCTRRCSSSDSRDVFFSGGSPDSSRSRSCSSVAVRVVACWPAKATGTARRFGTGTVVTETPSPFLRVVAGDIRGLLVLVPLLEPSPRMGKRIFGGERRAGAPAAAAVAAVGE